MADLFQLFLLLLMLVNLALPAVGGMPALIRLVAGQGLLLAALLLTTPGGAGFEHAALAAGVLLIKGLGFPLLLLHACRAADMQPLIRPGLGHGFAVSAGLAGLAFSLWLEGGLTVSPGFFPPLLFPAAMSTLFCGLIMIVSRARAFAQVIGYMAMENGIFLLGIPLLEEGALWFELTLLLDVFVAVFVMGIAVRHIGHTFESINVRRFCSLRD